MSLAIGATITCVYSWCFRHCAINDAVTNLSNNALQDAMMSLGMSSSAIKAIIDDPTILGDRFSASSSNKLAGLDITNGMAVTILDGYTEGFRIVFILNACLSALAAIASFLMIKHKELSRGDDEQLKAAGRSGGSEKDKDGVSVQVLPAGTEQDIEKACSVLELYEQQGPRARSADGVDATPC